MAIQLTYKTIERRTEPWGIDVRVSIFDEASGATIQDITIRFDSEKQADIDLPTRVEAAIQRLISTDYAGFSSEAVCGDKCVDGGCASGCKYAHVQDGGKNLIDITEGPRVGTLTVGEVEQVLRAKGVLLADQRWGEYALERN